MPGEIGEHVPRKDTIQLPETDISSVPSTEYRGIWHADDNFKRRSRFGGFLVNAGHALNTYLTKEQLTQNPEWNAERNGKRDIAIDTWADLGHLNDYGTMWYRHTVRTPKLPDGKKVFLWIAATDGSARVFVNGQHVPHVNAKGETVDAVAGYAEPFSFDITAVLKPDAENQITIAGSRLFINELGTGGLLGPVYLYREK